MTCRALPWVPEYGEQYEDETLALSLEEKGFRGELINQAYFARALSTVVDACNSSANTHASSMAMQPPWPIIGELVRISHSGLRDESASGPRSTRARNDA